MHEFYFNDADINLLALLQLLGGKEASYITVVYLSLLFKNLTNKDI